MTSYSGTAVTNGYSSDGLRAWKQTANGARLYFLYDGSVPVCETETVNGVSHGLLQTNTWGRNGLISEHGSIAGSSTCDAFDERGNIALRLDSTGTMQASCFTEAYGVTATLSSNYGASDWDPFDGFGAPYGYY